MKGDGAIEQVNLVGNCLPGVGGCHSRLWSSSDTNGHPHGYTYSSAAHRYLFPHGDADGHRDPRPDPGSYEHAPASRHAGPAYPEANCRPHKHAPAKRHTGATQPHSKPSAAYSHPHSSATDGDSKTANADTSGYCHL